MASYSGLTRQETTSLGRSGPRSKTGCQACKIRRVRCDEKRPICSHCDRLKLECQYLQPGRRRRQTNQRKGNYETNKGVERETSEDVLQVPGHSPDHPLPLQSGEPALGAATTRTQPSLSQVDASACDVLGREALSNLSMATAVTAAQSEEQSMFDFPSGVDSNATTLDGAAVDLSDFGPAAQEDLFWHAGPLNTLGLADASSFPFTSISFPDPIYSNRSRGWRNEASDLNLLADPATTFSIVENTGSDSTTSASPNATRSRAGSFWQRQSFVPSPPLLSPAQEEMLLRFFEQDLRPPASLVGVDPLGWLKIRRLIIRLAREKEQSVLHALYALSTLLSASNVPTRLGANKNGQILFASRLQEAASVSIEVDLSYAGWEKRRCHVLLVAVFILAWFETAYDEESLARPPFPRSLADKIILGGKSWDDGTVHILQWLGMLDVKMSHLGGHHLLSESALQIVQASRPGTLQSPGDHIISDGDADQRHHQGVNGSVSKGKAGQRTPHEQRLWYMLSVDSTTLTPQAMRLELFNILLQPAFEFHITSQAYSRRIGCHDRHHRTRGTPEDELEVINACMEFEKELQDLWKARPSILDLNAEQLRQFVSAEIAQRLEQLFSVYVATFWAHFLYIHRVAFWSLKHTPIAYKALEQVGNMMRRSVGQPMEEYDFDTKIPRTSSNSIHAGLMWTCFMFGCETPDPAQQKWAVLQLHALGKLHSTDADRGAGDGTDELLGFKLDEKGAQNAIKASQLLEILVQRQVQNGERVDGKYLSLELFGCHFYII